MNKSLLFIICAILVSLNPFGARAQGAAPYFMGGATQTLSVCENSAAASINGLLAVTDSDAAETETWSVLASPLHGTLAAAYSTTSTGGLLTPSGLTFMPSTGFSGSDTFAVEVSDGTLADTIMVYVTVRPLPVAGTISGAFSVCVGSSITLTSTAGGGSWSSSNATANITGAGLVTGLAAGLDTINYFVVNSCGFAYASTVITINPLPHAGTLSAAATVCVGAATTVSSTTTGGGWSLTNATASLAGDTVTGVTAGIDTIVYIVTTACGSDTAWRAITVNPLPVSGTITGAASVCEGATITDTASVTGGTWSATNTNATVATGLVTGAIAGMDTIVYTVSNSCGTATASHIITINPLPVTGTISGAVTVCVGASITLSETVTGGTWGASNASASMADSVVTGVAAGVDTISYSLTNACGTRAATYIVTVTGAPHAGPITGPDRVCRGSNITLSAPVSGTWSVTNGNVSAAGPVITGVAFGRDTVVNITSNSCGADTARHIVRVDTAAPHASMITGPYIVCERDTIRVADSVTGGTWHATNGNATINSTGRIRGNVSGLDTVFYVIANGCGADTARYTITINPLPHAGTVTGYDSVCIAGNILLHASAAGGMWVSDNSVFADVDTSGRVFGYLHGSVNIYYIVSNSCGSDSAAKHININVPAQPIIGSSTLCQGAVSALVDPIPGGTWSTAFTSYLVIGPVIGGTLIGITTGTATVTYTVRNACGTSTATFDVEVVVCDSTATGIASVAAPDAHINVAPNPGTGHFTITLPFTTNGMADVTLVNMLGEKVKTLSLPANRATEVGLSLPAGVYMLTATVKDEQYTTRLIVTE